MSDLQSNLVGHWPLQGDSQDHSGQGNHAVNHGVDLARGSFDGKSSYLSVAHSPSLALAGPALTLSAWVSTEKPVTGAWGDVLSKFDGATRKGVSLGLKSSAGGYNGPGDDRHVHFGIDDGRVGAWESCGRPSPYSNYVSNSLTVYNGDLYAATLDAAEEANWCHVYRYQGGQNWEDCGRVTPLRVKGAGPMIVHNGKLMVGTWSYDWTRVAHEDLDNCHVYEYAGGQEWIDRGQPGFNRRLFALASYQGKLYANGDDATGGVLKTFVYEGGTDWQVAASVTDPFFPHALGVYHGTLYIGTGSIHSFDGEKRVFAGTPLNCTQVHSLQSYRGELVAGTWPEGKLFQYQGGESWLDCGRLGDSTELNALVVYNGKLYAGSIPRAEVYRYEGGQEWTRLARFFDPPGWRPTLVEEHSREGLKEWTRVTSLTIYQGRLFASIGSCTGAFIDAPLDVRGEVYAMQAGKAISYDQDLGTDWQHLTAVREGGSLRLYVNGALAVESAAESPTTGGDDYQIANTEPLLIGFGTEDYFNGHLREVRVYDRALTAQEAHELYAQTAR